jgi:hypothetical protein
MWGLVEPYVGRCAGQQPVVKTRGDTQGIEAVSGRSVFFDGGVLSTARATGPYSPKAEKPSSSSKADGVPTEGRRAISPL